MIIMNRKCSTDVNLTLNWLTKKKQQPTPYKAYSGIY